MNARREFPDKSRLSCGTALGLVAIAVLLAGAAASLAAEPAADLFVAPQGNDAWSGRLAAPNAEKTDGPLATVDRAQKLVRELKSKEPDRQKPIVVMIRGGDYYLGQTIAFGPEDSGTEKAPVVYQAYPGERPVLSGGVRITGFSVGGDGRWRVTLDAVKQGQWNFAQLFVGDQRRLRVRLPKHGYYKIAKKLPPSSKAGDKGFDCFGFSGDEIKGDWANLGDVEVMPFHQWSASRMRIASVDAAVYAVHFTGTTHGTSSWAAFPEGHRYLVINVKEALSEPGEWYLDRPTGELTYIPMPGEKPDQTPVVAPRLDQIVSFVGDAGKQQWVRHVQFVGLTFAHTNWVLPDVGQVFPQADIGLDAAVSANGARDVLFDGCAVLHTGGYAMAFGTACRNNRIEKCEMVDLGGGGVKIGHAGRGLWGDVGAVSQEELRVSHHVVRDCLIAHGGRLHPASVGVWIGHSPHNTVEHNSIFDFYYTGLSIGWTWGYAESHAHHNEIAYNHVHTIGQGVLSDMGGIYTLGVSPGTTVHHNCFHDVVSFSYGGWGLYTDEGSSQIVMENNLVYRTKTGGFHQHYGRENRVQNNILAFATDQQIQRSRTEPHISFFFERNIVYWDNDSPLLGSNWNDDNFRMDHNCYWHCGKPVTFPGGLDLAGWQEKRGQDKGTIVADPGFADPAKGDFTLKPDSPALGVGFKPFDVSTAGRRGEPVLTKDLPPAPRAFE
jgi:hypothetical protein